jgi:hypothetical protein
VTHLNVRPRLRVMSDGFFKLNEGATCWALRDVSINVAHLQIVAQVALDIASPSCLSAMKVPTAVRTGDR